MTDIQSLYRDIFETTRTIAVYGMAAQPEKPSHYVAQFLADRGYRVIPVNPALAGQTLLGETVYASFADIPKDILVEMVDIFKRSEDVPPVVEEALAHLPALRTIWMQVGIENAEAAAKAQAAGKVVVQNACPKMVIPALYGAQHRTEFARQ